jgi:phenylacetate-CoA ligase
VRASLEDHLARLEWPRQRIERYQTERLRSLLGFARERSPFHAARMDDIEPSTATVEDLARLPPMVKQEAQDEWDAIITTPDIDRAGAERVLAEQAGSPTRLRDTRCSARAAQAAYEGCTSGIGSTS